MLIVIALATVGVLVMGLFLSRVYRANFLTTRAEPHGWLANLANIIGWGLIGLVALFFSCLLGPGGLVLFVVGSVVMTAILRQRRSARQYELLWLITVSAEHSIPLAPAIDAFAGEYRRGWRNQVRALAAQLAAGVSLPQALERFPKLLPSHALPLIRAGGESGALSAALRKAATGRLLFQPLWQSVMGRVFYISFLPLFALSFFAFAEIKLVPEFIKIFQEFKLRLPPLTVAVFLKAGPWLASSGLATLLVPLLVVAMIYVWLRCLGVTRYNLPGIRRLLRPLDGAVVLDALAIVTQQGSPLSDGVSALAESYPNRNIQRRLRKAAADMARGADWMTSLFAHGLLRRADRAILRSAQRVGNLPWAMEEMADSSRRRVAYRIQFLLQTLFPLVILAYGIIVMLIVAGFFICLPCLIENLA